MIPKKPQIYLKAFVKSSLALLSETVDARSLFTVLRWHLPGPIQRRAHSLPGNLPPLPKTNQDCKRNRQNSLDKGSRHCLFSCEQWYSVNPGAYFQPCILASWCYKGAQKVRDNTMLDNTRRKLMKALSPPALIPVISVTQWMRLAV